MISVDVALTALNDGLSVAAAMKECIEAEMSQLPPMLMPPTREDDRRRLDLPMFRPTRLVALLIGNDSY